MAELKTKKTENSVADFLNGIENERKRQDCFRLLELMQRVTGLEPKLWSNSLVGFGDYHYKYASGREGDWFILGFSPRKQALTLYLTQGVEGKEELLGRLGKHTTGMGCIYVKSLNDIDMQVLEEILTAAAKG
jgi:hypothetical protein